MSDAKKNPPCKIETQCIHGILRNGKKHPFGAISTPIYQTSTFSHPGVESSTGYEYTRESNPTRAELESVVSTLENAYDTVACSTGMAALCLLMELFPGGSHILCSEDLYGGSVRMFETVGRQRNLSFSYVDTTDSVLTERSIKPNTVALYIETPSNPTMQITDLCEMKKIAERHDLRLIVDNTFLSPYFQNPITLGADFVIHSGTKFLGGHNDALAGFICAKNKEDSEKIRYAYKTTGSCLSPFDSFLILRGIKTLHVRMDRQQENALKIADWLKNHKKVKKVYYVGLKDHPGYETNKKQASGFGSMISFLVDSKETASQVLERTRIIAYAESLGGVESLITYPMLQTHGDLPPRLREKLGITDCFLRLSVGVENVDDLIGDLAQALA